MAQTLSYVRDSQSSEARPEILFTTLGMVILDEIYLPSDEPLIDIIGGSGAYSTLGARLFYPGTKATSLGWMIRAGNDFPLSIKKILESWGTSLFFEVEQGLCTTRARLEYEDTSRDKKNFQYLTPVLQILPSHFESITALLGARSFHFLASPMEVEAQISSLLMLRERANIKVKPLLVWEPRPSSCTPANHDGFFQAVQKIDVFTPNHVELAAIFGHSNPEIVDADLIQAFALEFQDPGSTIIVRAGERGCFVAAGSCSHWLPPYYKPVGEAPKRLSPKVVDPTGAGNAFVGAFATAFLDTRDMYRAACYGNVGASFAVEQIGLPELGGNEEGEVWNNVNPHLRLKEYMSRLEADC